MKPSPPGKLLLVHVALLTVAFFSFGGYRNQPSKIESDGKYYYQFLLSAWFDGDFDFANNYRVARKPFMVHGIDHYDLAARITPTGRPVNFFTTGPAVLWSPFFAVSWTVGWMLEAAAVLDSPPDGWERPFQLSVMFAAVVYSTLALVLLYRLLIPHFRRGVVLTSLALVFWATNWLYYSVFEPSMSHVYDLFTLVLFVWTCRRAAESGAVRWHAGAGLAAGLHVLVRTQNLASVVILLLFFRLVPAVEGSRRARLGGDVRNLAVLLAVLLVTLVPLMASNLALFGEVLVVPQSYEGGFLRMASPHLVGVLFSARNGLFSHHPVLLLAVAGVIWAVARRRANRELLRGLLLPLGLVFLVQLWINASAVDWWGGHAFGQRRLMSSLLLFALGFAVLLEAVEARLPRGRRVVIAAVALAVAFNLYLTVLHVFAWSYDEPHDILDWLFVRGPAWIAGRLAGG